MATTANGTPYVESSDLVANYPAVSLALANKVDFFAKIRQVVRATDTTLRTTTSTSFTDAGISVTITPQRNTSAILLISTFALGITATAATNVSGSFVITDNGNNLISGAQDTVAGPAFLAFNGSFGYFFAQHTAIAYATPGTTSAVTYKLRFLSNTASTTSVALRNNANTGQMYAIEVAA